MKQLNRILLVDDDYINNIISEEIIRKMNIAKEIHILTNGKDAIEYIETHCLSGKSTGTLCAEIILLDLNMPVMNGFEFLEKFISYKLTCNIQIFILTTSGDSRDIEKTAHYNIAGFINKPLTSDKLNQVLNRASNLQ